MSTHQRPDGANVRRLPQRRQDRQGPARHAQVEAGAPLLAELHAALCRFVIFPSPEAADAVALWVAATHAQPAWEHAPRLAVVSPLKRCGKSRLLDVVAETCHAPLITVNATIAAVVRSIGEDPPTLLVDEADTLWGTKRQADQNEDLRGLLNAGHQRNRPMLRWDVTTKTAEHLTTFAMAMLAAIGELPDTIMDRAVVIRMRRRAPGEQVEPYRTRRDAPPLNELRERLTTWTREHLRQLQRATPRMPLEDRAADTWEPLIAVADLAGESWPARARAAALAMTGAEAQREEDSAASVRLLADLRDLYQRTGADGLHTATILEALHKLDDAPWSDWYGHPLRPRELSGLLKLYQVEPKSVRERGTGKVLKGYAAADLYDAWRRYLPTPPTHPLHHGETAAQSGYGDVSDGQAPAVTSDTTQGPVAAVSDVTAGPDGATAPLSRDVTAVSDVTDTPAQGDSDGWQFGQPMAPCTVCGTGTTNRTPNGQPLHLVCAHRNGNGPSGDRST